MNKQSQNLQSADNVFLQVYEEVVTYMKDALTTLGMATPGNHAKIFEMIGAVEDDKKAITARVTQKNFQDIDQFLTTSADAIKAKNLTSNGDPYFGTEMTEMLDKYLTARNNYCTQAANPNLETPLQAERSTSPDEPTRKNASSQASLQVSAEVPSQLPPQITQSQNPAQAPTPSAPPAPPETPRQNATAAASAPEAQPALPLVATQPLATAAIQKLSAAKQEYAAAADNLKAQFPDGHPMKEASLNSMSEINRARPSNVKTMLAELQNIERKSLGAGGAEALSVSQREALDKFSAARENYVNAGLEKHHSSLYQNASAKGFSAAEPSNQIAPAIVAAGVKAAPQEGEVPEEGEEKGKTLKGIGKRPPGTDPLDHLADLKGDKVFWESVDADGNKTKSEININDDGSVSTNDPEALAKYVAAKGYTNFDIDKGEPHDVILAMQAMEKEGVPNVTLSGAAKDKMDKLVKKDPDSDIAKEYGRLEASFKASSAAYDKPGAFLDPGTPPLSSPVQQPVATAPVSQAAIGGAFSDPAFIQPPDGLSPRTAANASAPTAAQVQNVAAATSPVVGVSPPTQPPTATPDTSAPPPSAPPLSDASPRTQKAAMEPSQASSPPQVEAVLTAPSSVATEVISEPVKAASAPSTPPPTLVTPGYNDPETLQKKDATSATPTTATIPADAGPSPTAAPTPHAPQPTNESAAPRLDRQEAAAAAQKGNDKVSSPSPSPAAKATEKKAPGKEQISELAAMMKSGDIKGFVKALIEKITSAVPGDSSNLLQRAEKDLDKLDAKIDKDIGKLEIAKDKIDLKIAKVDEKMGKVLAEVKKFDDAIPTPSPNANENKKIEKKEEKGHEHKEKLVKEVGGLREEKNQLESARDKLDVKITQLHAGKTENDLARITLKNEALEQKNAANDQHKQQTPHPGRQ